MTTISQNICRICENNANKLIDVSAPQLKSLVNKYVSCAHVTVSCPQQFQTFCIAFIIVLYTFYF